MDELTNRRHHAGFGELGPDESLPACFERLLPVHASRVAFGAAAWRATYQELNETANRLAHSILRRDGSPGDRIAVLMAHDTPLIAAMLAVLKAAGILVVLNPAHPAARLRQVMKHAEPRLIVADANHDILAAEIAGPDCGIVRFGEESREGPAGNPSIEIDPAQTAFLVYTSGSGGVPKGVMQTHRQCLHIVRLQTKAMQYTAADHIPLFGSLSHGHAIATALYALLNGARLFPFPMEIRGVTGLGDWIIDNGITSYVSSASIFRNFMKTLDADVRFPLVHSVRLSSEPATSDDFKEFQKHFPENCRFVHSLMSSETSHMAMSIWRRNDKVPEGRLPVGVATDGHEVLLLDERGHAVGPGEVGEIVVRSRFMAAGYWRNPELTAERFSNDVDGGGRRTFRTGDLGRINAGGLLEFCGRRDTRVKIRGNRIELSEVADALRRLPGIDQAAVDAIERPNHEAALVGYVVIDDGHSWSAARLRRTLRAILPEYMVPSTFVVLDRLPLTSIGKIDREKLRELALAQPRQNTGEAPYTETELLLARIWAEVFELSDVRREDDFFGLGGDSLMAAVVAAQVHASLGVELDLSMIAGHPTLAELAGAIDKLQPPASREVPALVRASRDRPLPLSFWQERIWMFSQTPEESAGYSVAGAQRIVGPLDVDILRDCMSYMAKRHEILRTTYGISDGRPVQIVHPAAPVPLPVLDVSGSADPEAEAVRVRKKEAAFVFDLARGPLIRFSLVRLRDNEHWLLRVAHSICTDTWSWGIYFQELALLYEAKLHSRPPPLSESAHLQYGDYAVWQRRELNPEGQAFKDAVAWWKAALADASGPVRLPFTRHTVEKVDAAAGRIRWGIEYETSQQLNALGGAEGAT